MGAVQILDDLLRDPTFRSGVALDHLIPARDPAYAEIPEGVPGNLRDALAARGIQRLYSHQADVFNCVAAGQDTVVVTPTTASRKPRCRAVSRSAPRWAR